MWQVGGVRQVLAEFEILERKSHALGALFLNPAVVWVMIPIVAIVVTGIQQIIRMVLRHRERIAMIEQGIHPDADAPSHDANSEMDWRLRTTTSHSE
ncbi:MAG: hypothetical protein R3C28_02935 [Pirellulaceae bacterium]